MSQSVRRTVTGSQEKREGGFMTINQKKNEIISSLLNECKRFRQNFMPPNDVRCTIDKYRVEFGKYGETDMHRYLADIDFRLGLEESMSDILPASEVHSKVISIIEDLENVLSSKL